MYNTGNNSSTTHKTSRMSGHYKAIIIKHWQSYMEENELVDSGSQTCFTPNLTSTILNLFLTIAFTGVFVKAHSVFVVGLA